MWITITNQRILPKDAKFISEIHVTENTNNISDILISVGESMKRVENREAESIPPKTNIEPRSVEEWLKENTPKVKLSNAKLEDLLSKERFEELCERAKREKWESL